MQEVSAGVPVDHCWQCQGIWFDVGELEAMRAISYHEHEHSLLSLPVDC